MLGTGILALLAGIFSALSPCVLPLIPVVIGASVSSHRFGPIALSLGLAVSFVSIGLFVAMIGFSIGLDLDLFRLVGGLVMASLGTVLVVPSLQTRATALAGPIGDWSQQHFGHVNAAGLKGQFLIGLLLGTVWSPCVGPTLGAASVLASTGKNLGQVAITMLAFGIGATIPLLAIGALSRERLLKSRTMLVQAGKSGKMLLGGFLLLIGLLIVSGLDKKVETFLLSNSPSWLTALTTQF
ncbi:MAG: cytochrome c biogenesis protein CcdA [Oxalobacteraceae bacterium]|nr:MAG: cytochrome c biogenesis protein CcdA [Oxalobacteraceae bacterium]